MTLRSPLSPPSHEGVGPGLQHCSRIVPPSLSKWRLDPAMTSNGFKWGCAKAILSSFIFGVELTTTNVSHSMVFHIGDTKSAQELEVFLRMPRERLRLCCGIKCTDSLHSNGPRQRRKLFTAALKLLRFAIGIETVCCENEEQRALQTTLLPLLQPEDGHVLASRQNSFSCCPSGGVTVFDPSLQLVVLTKENVAAHAVAEHLVSLQLPDRIQGKMGRLVGYYEQNRTGSYTPLDILPSNRNQVIRQKSLLIGCGGGFQQECSQQISPVADWMSSVDLFLEDEGQQYGNMEEAACTMRQGRGCSS